MNATDVRAMLNYPDVGLVQYALDKVNLNADEWQIIKLREYHGQTIEQAAEQLYLSTDTVKRRYRAGMGKLCTCWGAMPWINSIIKS